MTSNAQNTRRMLSVYLDIVDFSVYAMNCDD